MAELLTCPRGHRFDITAAGTNSSAHTLGTGPNSVTCPICGAECDTSPEIGVAPKKQSADPTIATFNAFPQNGDAAAVEAGHGTAVMRPSSPPPLLTIPGYEFLEKLGQGGMGIVFKARQIGLNRVVALKMILGSYSDNPQDLARFQIEAEALASLQHPNIVQVFDVGTFEDSPFFAMEFVDGGGLDSKLDGKPLPPREVARLIELLARAMHAAHQRGIIHRDLKPVNVLLTKDGTPKIVDFGLAKRLEQHDDRTLPGAILGTPNYMAPEQAFGKSRDVGPATDVHALGAMMYEMLTGQQPFRGNSALTTLENVRKFEPPAPAKHQPGIPRDLDVICLKCLQKEPGRRYATAEALANDLCRFREGRPIQARPTGVAERAVKWIRRRPALAALLALIVVISAYAIWSGIWHNIRLRDERDRAEKNFQMALNAVDEMLTVFAEEQLGIAPQMERKRRDLLLKAQEFYTKLLQEKREDPAMRRVVAQGYKRVGDIHRWLGENDKSEASYTKAIDALEALALEYPHDQEPRQYLADSLVYRGEIWRLANRNDEAAQAYDRALRIQQQLLVEFPGKSDLQKDLARTYYNLGILYKDTGKQLEAQKALENAVEIGEKLTAAYPDRLAYKQHLGRSYLNLATVLWRTTGFEPASKNANKAIETFRFLIGKNDLAPEYQQELAVSHNNLGNIYRRQGDVNAAKSNYEEALKLFKRLAANFPGIPIYRQEAANTLNSLAALLASDKRTEEAVVTWQEAEKIQSGLVEENLKVPSYRGDLGMTRASLGRVYLTRKDLGKAKSYLLASIADLEHALATNANQPDYLNAAQFAYVNLGHALVGLKEDAEAHKHANRLVDSFPHRDRGLVVALCFLASCYEASGQESAEAKMRAEGFAVQAETIIRTAQEAGRLKTLEQARDERDFGPLANNARIVALLPAKK